MQMTLYDFIKLNQYEQANAVWDCRFIADRNEGDSNVLLYSLGDFFVEVTYQGDLNKITLIKPFKTRRLLEPYWESVSLQEIEGLL